jgi:hypothetical protein
MIQCDTDLRAKSEKSVLRSDGDKAMKSGRRLRSRTIDLEEKVEEDSLWGRRRSKGPDAGSREESV